MKIIKINDKSKIGIEPLFFTENVTKSVVLAFYPEEEKDKTSLKGFAKDLIHGLLYRNKVNEKADADLWEVFLEEFLFTLYCEEYQIVVYTGIDITDNFEKCQTEQFIFQKEQSPTIHAGVYFSINQNEQEVFRNMALFDFYWALNDYTILIFSKEYVLNAHALHHIANGQYDQAFLMAEIQIKEDGQLAECIYKQKIQSNIYTAHDKALLKIKEFMLSAPNN